MVDPDGLPGSWEAARTALRLTAEGTPGDPGPRVVHADEAGGLLALAHAVGPDTPEIADVTA
ncbi:PucR family transcriptional regulator, partial [Actinomadura sp. LOL_011]